MKRFYNFFSSHRILAISAFSVVYPFAACFIVAEIPPQLWNALRHAFTDLGNLLLSGTILFAPPLATLWKLPLAPTRYRAATIVILSGIYLLVMIPLLIFVALTTHCFFGFNCRSVI